MNLQSLVEHLHAMDSIVEHDHDDVKYQDLFNPYYNPDKNPVSVASTGIERNDNYTPAPTATKAIPTGIPSNPSIPLANNDTKAIEPKYFDTSSARLLIPPGKAKQLATSIYQEVSARIPSNEVYGCLLSILQVLMAPKELDEVTLGHIREIAPTLADVYDEFTQLSKNPDDILELGVTAKQLIKPLLDYLKKTQAS